MLSANPTGQIDVPDETEDDEMLDLPGSKPQYQHLETRQSDAVQTLQAKVAEVTFCCAQYKDLRSLTPI